MIKNDVEPVSYHKQEKNASIFSPYIITILLCYFCLSEWNLPGSL